MDSRTLLFSPVPPQLLHNVSTWPKGSLLGRENAYFPEDSTVVCFGTPRQTEMLEFGIFLKGFNVK